jgi:hypothetical protein
MYWLLILLLVIGVAIGTTLFMVYNGRQQQKHEQDCFDAMLKMLLQPTSTNIGALEDLLKKRSLNSETQSRLLYEAELEADCLSIMPTGEVRSSQPFLQKRYDQILASADEKMAVAQLVKSRLGSFKINKK